MADILVVDDDSSVLDACRLFLEREKHEVRGAFSRGEGMQQIREKMPDLLILDVMMEQPDDGIAMAQQLRQSGFVRPILMLTSVNKVMQLEYGKDADILPVDAFEEKPISPERLISLVNSLLRGKE
ncbi:MAG TPA: response regulator [Candidatus Sumerlaeota bacterium]|nr:response regulator [Candidatus Sumerlaeota bacterium]